MQYAHTVIEHPIEDLIGIPDKWNDMHSRPLDDFGSHVRARGYMCDDRMDPEFNRGSYRVTKRAAVGRNLAKVSYRALAVPDFIRGGTT